MAILLRELGAKRSEGSACEQSLRRLGVPKIDLLYLHRKSPSIPIEDSAGEMGRLVEEGKVCDTGLSEVEAPSE